MIDMFCVKDPLVFLSSKIFFFSQQIECQADGWEVICAADSTKRGDRALAEGKDIEKAKPKGNNRIVVFGSEGEGVDPDILELADSCRWVENRMKNKDFPNSLVDSLNVSVAAGVVLNDLLK
jgi:tRNA G18 (ribose-2'-O)-methylase SpoU